MNDFLRFLVTVDPAGNQPVKVEEVGAVGDLTPVNLSAFLLTLGPLPGNENMQPGQAVTDLLGEGDTAMPVGVGAQPAKVAPVMGICGPAPLLPRHSRSGKPDRGE